MRPWKAKIIARICWVCDSWSGLIRECDKVKCVWFMVWMVVSDMFMFNLYLGLNPQVLIFFVGGLKPPTSGFPNHYVVFSRLPFASASKKDPQKTMLSNVSAILWRVIPREELWYETQHTMHTPYKESARTSLNDVEFIEFTQFVFLVFTCVGAQVWFGA